MSLDLIGALVAMLFGLISEFEAKGRNFAGWGVVVLAFLIVWASR